jgi:hypothetical protein
MLEAVGDNLWPAAEVPSVAGCIYLSTIICMDPARDLLVLSSPHPSIYLLKKPRSGLLKTITITTYFQKPIQKFK